ncbi:MAG: GerMN domain-containing protein [Lachnospiraceae bacterium]|nr:GerMN domain-containing protein [Lachnospiraceae bacterium]
MKKRVWRFVLLCAALLLAGCSERREDEESGYKIWYLNQDETSISYEYRELQAKTTEGMVSEMLELLQEDPVDEELVSALPEEVRVLDSTLEGSRLSLDFSGEYSAMEKTREVLGRAAYVRTFCQLQGVEYVSFLVDGESLTDTNGVLIGYMNDEQFIESAGEESTVYKTAELTLYFTNEAGDELVAEQVTMEYNSNISLEKLIVEELISGPISEGLYPMIPPETKLISISIKDGICYVNLDETFLESVYNVAEAVPIYAIVNSIVDNTDAEQVQISINGETNQLFRETISFNTIFEKNEELIEE